MHDTDVQLARILLPAGFGDFYDYKIPKGRDIHAGCFVEVPFGKQVKIGVVWGIIPSTDSQVPFSKLKEIGRIIDNLPTMPGSLMEMIDWVASYTMSHPGSVLRMAMSVPSVFDESAGKTQMGWKKSDILPRGVRMTPDRARVLDSMRGNSIFSTKTLTDLLGITASVLRGMAGNGLILSVPMPSPPVVLPPDPAFGKTILSLEQGNVATQLRASVKARKFSTTLLTGVTGSGKTEVYLEAVAEALEQNRQSLVLLPEIALSSQWLERFEKRFGVTPAIWHSELTDRRRRDIWRAVATGEAPVLVGARSALFLPFPDLGLVIVDEEHETGFKQEEGVIYNARDMALVRAKLSEAAAMLVSATPSLETVTQAKNGRYKHLNLNRRHGAAGLPEVGLIDLRRHPPERGSFISPVLCEAVDETLAKGEQVMLFLNRRGYAPLTLCRRCGNRLRCPNCTAWLVEHKSKGNRQCHHCGHATQTEPECKECGAEDSMTPVGPGVERILEEATKRWPDARRLVMASDTIVGPNAANEAAKAIVDRKIDLILGTQIVAKGWNFPHLTLVGIIDADLGLAGTDLRSGERTIQLLHQVAGRAGRAEFPGRVFLQTFSPDHPVMQSIVRNDIDAFMNLEAEARKPFNMPPFGRLAALVVSSENPREAEMLARDLGVAAPGGEGVKVLGPSPAPLAQLRGWHRHRLLLKTRRDIAVQPIVREWLSRVEIPATAKLQVDIDPMSFM
jgi:primosomal protein N' (replication factor Y)